jgi:hypothetical protein
VKRIETRSWSTKFRGPLAIHAAARKPRVAVWRYGDWWLDGDWLHRAGRELPNGMVDYSGVNMTHYHVHLGAVVATCELVDCLPIDSVEHDCQEAREYDRIVDSAPHRHGLAHLWERDGGWHLKTVEDQRPYGDFAVGRWAWLLADIKPVDPPVPAKGKQGLWEWSA